MSPGHTGEGRGVVLVGSRGTGKSTVGRLLSGRLGLPFVDADPALEARFGCSIRSIFEEHGEPIFRDREQQVVAELTAGPPTVLATGGGVVLRPENRAMLRRFGFVVWLSADPSVLAARLAASPQGLADRPALTPAGTLAEIAAVLTARAALYREVADAEVATDARSVDEVVEAVARLVPGVGS